MKQKDQFFYSIRFRLGLLLIFIIAVFIAYFYIVSAVDKKNDDKLYKSRIHSKQSTFNYFSESTSNSLQTFAYDYSFWDDMVNFVQAKGKNSDFAKLNIDPGLDTFKANAAWVYTTNNELIYSVNNFDGEVQTGTQNAVPIDLKQMRALFKHNGVFHYYTKTNLGIFEIYAATVHPSDDSERKTPSKGYLFVGKKIEGEYLAQAGQAIESNVQVINGAPANISEKGEFNEHTGEITFDRPLKDFNDKTIGVLHIKHIAKDLAEISKSHDKLILVGYGIFSAVSIILFATIIRWAILPLGNIQKALSKQSDQPVSKFKSKKNEFGQIARLVSYSLWQRHELLSEKASVEKQVIERTNDVENEKRTLETLLNNLPVGVFVVQAPDGKPLMINSAGEKILGRGANTSITSRQYSEFYDVIKEDGSLYPVDDLPLNITLRTGEPCTKDDILIRQPNGLTIALRVVAAPVKQLDGTTRTAVSVFEDISKDRELEHSRDEFFSIASHELRTPLTAIRGNTSLMQQIYGDKIETQDMKEMIDDIHESSVRLIEIVNDFLDTSRLEQKRIKFELSKFNAVEVAESVIKEFETTGSRTKNELVVKKPADHLPFVLADKNRYKQVLINLVGNGIKFTDEGKISISFGLEGDFVKVYVSDTGQGIPLESQKQLFKKFEQVGSSVLTRDSVRGTGLGLYISKMIIEQMGGHIRLESSSPGHGTTFSFTVPVAKQ